jgi:integrase
VAREDRSSDHIFLYRNALLMKNFIRKQLKVAREQVGVKVYPHRLRHTCATQLLNVGSRVTSIQRFLGHGDLASTMIYAHVQTVADDYFAAMQRVEQRVQIIEEKKGCEVVKVQELTKVVQLIERLELPNCVWENG